MKKLFSDRAWEDYLHWQEADRKLLRKINTLIADIERTPYSGLGKPEPLKHAYSGWWSRRIDGEHRLVYRVDEDEGVIEFLQLRFHYGD